MEASTLLATASVAIAAKTIGVIVAPGVRGVASSAVVNALEVVSGGLAYLLVVLAIGLIFLGSFELAKARGVNTVGRGGVVAVSGLIIAMAAPAIWQRLSTLQSLALAVVASLVAFVAGMLTIRAAATRAVGAVLVLSSLASFLRVVAWELASVALERGGYGMLDVARGVATVGVMFHVLGALLAAAWIGTRSKWRGRILANGAILVAFGLTWLAARTDSEPTAFEAVLRTTLPGALGLPAPFFFGATSAFLLPASILLAAVALLQRAQPVAIAAALALTLLSGGALDVPIQALLVTAGAQWLLFAASAARAAA